MNKLTFFKLPLLVFFFFNAFCSFAQQEDWQWVNQFGSQYKDLVNNGDEEIWDMEVDDSGNVYLVGQVWGPVTIDTHTFNLPTVDASGFVAKFNCSGEFQWFTNINYPMENAPLVKSKTGNGFFLNAGSRILNIAPDGTVSTFFQAVNGGLRAIEVGENGSIYTLIYGINGNVWEYDPGHFIHPDTTYFAVHDSTGAVLSFAPIFHSTTGGIPSLDLQLKRTSTGELFVAGTTQAYTTFEVIGGDTINPNGTSYECFIIKLDQNGSHLWTKKSEGGGEIDSFFFNEESNEIVFTFNALFFGGIDVASNLMRRPGYNNISYIVAVMNASGSIVYYDNFGRTPVPNPLDKAENIAQFGSRISIALRISEGYPIQYGTAETVYINGSNNLSAPGFIEFDTVIDDGVNDQYLYIDNYTSKTSNSMQITYDNLGNLNLSGAVPQSIQHNGQTLPFQGGDYDLFLAKWGIDSCPVPTINTTVCATPQQLSVQNVDSNSAIVAWVDSANTGNYFVEWGISGFSLGSGDTATTTGLSLTINGLLPNSTYEGYVKSLCNNDSSSFAGPVGFTTTDTGGTGMAEYFAANVRVYPNPANTAFTVHSSHMPLQGVAVFALTGEVVYRSNHTSSEQLSIATANWPNGLYLLQLTAQNGVRTVQKISVLH